MPKPCVRFLLIDENQEALDWVREVLSRQFDSLSVRQVANADEFSRLVKSGEHFDCALISIPLHWSGEHELLDELSARFPKIPRIGIAPVELEPGMIAASEAGLDDIVSRAEDQLLRLSHAVSLAMKRNEQPEAAASRRPELEHRLKELSRTISSAQDTDVILEQVVCQAADLVGAASGVIGLLSPEEDALYFGHGYNLPPGLDFDPLHRGTGAIWEIVEEQRAGRSMRGEQPLPIPSDREKRGLGPFIGAPLIARNECLGVLLLFNPRNRSGFSESDLDLVAAIGYQAGVAVQNARLLNNSQRRLEELTLLVEANEAVSSSLNMNTVLKTIAQQIIAAVDVDGCCISLWQQEQDELITLLDYSNNPLWKGDEPGTIYRLKDFPTTRFVLKTRQPVTVSIYEPEIFPDEIAWMKEQNCNFVLMLPLVARGQVIGLVELINFVRHQTFSTREIELCQALANQMASALENARLFVAEARRSMQLRAGYELSQALSTTVNAQEAAEIVADNLVDQFGYEIVAIFLVSEEDRRLDILCTGGPAASHVAENYSQGIDQGVIGQSVQQREPVLVNNTEQNEHFFSLPGWDPKSELCVPIMQDGRVAAVIVADVMEPNAFTENDVVLLQMAGQELLNAWSRARLFGAERKRREEAETLRDVTSELASTLETPQVLENILIHLERVIPYDSACVLLVEGACLHAVAGRGFPDPDLVIGVKFPLENELFNTLARTLQPVILEDAQKDSRFVVRDGTDYIRGWMGVPLLVHGQLIGQLTIDSRQPNAFTEMEAAQAQAFANQAALAIRNAHLFEETRRQARELSGVYEAAVSISSALEPDELLKRVYDQIQALIAPDTCIVTLLDAEAQEIRVALAMEAGVEVPDANGLRVPVEEAGLTGWISRTCRPLLVMDMENDVLPARPRHGLRPARAWIGVPLVTRDRLIGTISVQSFLPGVFDEGHQHLLESFASQVAIALENARLYQELEEAFLQSVLALANAMDARDSYTNDHSQRMAALAEAIARDWGLSEEEISIIRWGALLHDIGKIGVPDHILLKPGPLDDLEWTVMRKHPEIGGQIIAPVKNLKQVAQIISAHQEKFDGTGYPARLKGDEIPIGARILAVVDAYSAIIDDRVYRKARPHIEALAEIKNNSGTQFDPEVVEIFTRLVQHGE